MSSTNPHKPAISYHHNYRHSCYKLPESAALLLTNYLQQQTRKLQLYTLGVTQQTSSLCASYIWSQYLTIETHYISDTVCQFVSEVEDYSLLSVWLLSQSLVILG